MEAAEKIRAAVATVAELRARSAADPALQAAVRHIKQWQSRRFAGSYADLLAHPHYQEAARFFLEELYGEQDFAERDAQFSRIAGAIQQLLPRQADTAVALAELHALTETLDHAMGRAWLDAGPAGALVPAAYARAWKKVGQRAERHMQVALVVGIGRDLAKLTRAPGMRLMLKMMRGPAMAAGLGALQRFLESGFDTFAALSRHKAGVEDFLSRIQERETAVIDMLFDAAPVACETALTGILGQAR